MRASITDFARTSLAQLTRALIVAALLAGPIHAQGNGAIRGKIIDQDGRPIAGAQSVLSPGTRRVVSGEDGSIAIANVSAGSFMLSTRRIGYQAATTSIVVRDAIVDVVIRMTVIPRQLDSVRVREKVSGLRYSAVVVDLNGQPVSGAEIVAMGVSNKLTTDSLGRFTVGGLSHATLAVRVRKMGYQATLSSIRMLADRADTIYMPRLAQSLSKVEIDERSGFGNDYWSYRELDQRQRWKTAMAGMISREELDERGKQDLCDALPGTSSGAKLSLAFDPSCKDPEKGMKKLLIDGAACRNGLLADYSAEDVELVEVLPPERHPIMPDGYGGSLASRGCGGKSAPGKRPSLPGLGSTVTETVYAIWLRKKENGTKPIVPKPRTLVGVVFDSIAKRPLAGAHVTLEDLKRETVADSLGAFHFDSVASGVHALKADHETLDLIGWPSLRDTVDLAPELITNVTLAIPSFATLWRRVCDDSIPARATEGLIYGRVLLGPAAVASTDTSGTVVEASWRGIAVDSAGDADSRKQVPADSAGNYAVCGAPVAMPITLSALSHGTATVSVSFSVGDVRIARRDLMLPASDIIDRLVADSASAPPLPAGEGATLSGTVRDSLGKPLSDAHIAITGVSGEWRTNAKGVFTARGIPSGARVVASTQVGFLPERRLVDLSDADSVGVDLSMTRVATFLDTLKVSGKQSPRTTTLLDIASRRKLGLGYAADSTKLELLPGSGLRDAFNFPSVRVVQPPRGGPWQIYMTDHARSIDPTKGLDANGCLATIFVDGTPSSIQLVNDMSKEEIGLVEVFTSPSRAPSEYAGSGGNCGIVLLWRKRYLRP